MKDKVEEILDRHERDDVFGITQELLHLIQEERKEAVRGFAEWLNAHDFLFRDNMIMKLYEQYLSTLGDIE